MAKVIRFLIFSSLPKACCYVSPNNDRMLGVSIFSLSIYIHDFVSHHLLLAECVLFICILHYAVNMFSKTLFYVMYVIPFVMMSFLPAIAFYYSMFSTCKAILYVMMIDDRLRDMWCI